MIKLSYKILTLVAAIIILANPTALFAQSIGFGGEGGGTVNIIASRGFFNTAVASETFLDTTFGQLIAIFLGFLGAIFLVLIIYSGFQWMTAGGNEEKVEEAKKRILNASLGLGLVFFSYIITSIVFNFLYKQGNKNQPPAQVCLTDADCGRYEMICVSGVCQEREQPGNVRCENDVDCPPMQPKCQSFLGMNAKWCTCNEGEEPSCPQNFHCVEDLIGSNQCERDES